MSQKSKVLKHMRETGSVSRNWALQNYITRLSAIMLDLKNEGVAFEGKWKDNDYLYHLLDKPKRVDTFYVNGTKVAPDRIVW